MKTIRFAGLLFAFAAIGCGTHYTVPGGPAQLSNRADTDPNIRSAYDSKPLANFPAMISVVRLQSPDYRSRTSMAYYGGGPFSIVTTRDVETDADFERISNWAGIAGVAPINRMLLSSEQPSEESLRRAAARTHSDMVLMYTFDTQFYVKDFAGPVTVFTLGLSPNMRAYVTTTASAMLVDTRTGYIYGGAEATAKSDQLANGWTSDDAVDDTRLRTEKESFGKLLGELEKTWAGVLKQYTPSTKPPTTAP
ncbi:MAG: hypothetical protein QM754_02015 [Tepidisphaeraceae bacterium]